MLKLVFIFALLSPYFAVIAETQIIKPAEKASPNSVRFVVWNVGQGLWTTLITNSICWHFDLGGEKVPWKKIIQSCNGKMNRVSFSHWDWDHISFIRKANKKLTSFCIENLPAGPIHPKRMELMNSVQKCSKEFTPFKDISQVIQPQRFKTERSNFVSQNTKKNQPSTNESSRVFLVAVSNSGNSAETEKYILIPGDSVAKAEKTWKHALPKSDVQILVLGHHGSNTSTSLPLLNNLTDVHSAIASSRFLRYRHPHIEVVKRLKKVGIALLKTEDWGSIYFDFSKSISGGKN